MIRVFSGCLQCSRISASCKGGFEAGESCTGEGESDRTKRCQRPEGELPLSHLKHQRGPHLLRAQRGRELVPRRPQGCGIGASGGGRPLWKELNVPLKSSRCFTTCICACGCTPCSRVSAQPSAVPGDHDQGDLVHLLDSLLELLERYLCPSLSCRSGNSPQTADSRLQSRSCRESCCGWRRPRQTNWRQGLLS